MPQAQQNLNRQPLPPQNFSQQRQIQPTQKTKRFSIIDLFRKDKKLAFFGGLSVVIVVVSIIVLVVSMINQPTQVNTPKEATITFWTRQMDDTALNEIIDNFQKDNPLIKVKHETQSDTDYKTRITTRLKLQSTNIGNIVEMDEAWLDETPTSLAPITDATILGRYSVATVKNNSINNVAVAVPFEFDGLVLAYNQDHLSEINFTEEDFNKLDWTFLANRALSLTKTKSINLPDKPGQPFSQITRSGAAVGSPITVTNAAQILQLLLIQDEAKIYDPVTGKFTLSDKFTEVMKFYTDFAVNNVWSNDLGNDVQAFSQGKVSIVLVRSSDLDNIKKLNPNLRFATAIPAKIGGIRNISLSKSLIIPNYMPNYAESIKFLEYLTRSENSLKLFNSKTATNTFVPAQITSLNQIPKTSPFAVYSDINTTADKFISPNYENTTAIMSNYLINLYSQYNQRSGFGDKNPINVNTASLQNDLDAYIRNTTLQ